MRSPKECSLSGVGSVWHIAVKAAIWGARGGWGLNCVVCPCELGDLSRRVNALSATRLVLAVEETCHARLDVRYAALELELLDPGFVEMRGEIIGRLPRRALS